jgi:hypothetical protein
MSMEMLAQVLHKSQHTGSAYKLLLVIAYHTNPQTGLAWPSRRLLAAEIRVGERYLKRLLRRLVKSGELEIRPGQGRGHLSVYRIHLDDAEVIHRKGGLTPLRVPLKRGPIEAKKRGPFGVTVEPKERREEAPSLLCQERLAGARRCGWGSCTRPVCPHEVNFCAGHAGCERCAAEGNR